MALYRINHPATGRVVNLYISSSTGSVPNGTPLSLYPWQDNSDQKFEMEYVGNHVIFRLQRDTTKVINRNASTNAAMFWPYSTDKATLNDSLINTETENGNMRIKLVNQNLYLTKDANSYMLYWKSKEATNRQYFALEQLDGSQSGGGTGNGTGGWSGARHSQATIHVSGQNQYGAPYNNYSSTFQSNACYIASLISAAHGLGNIASLAIAMNESCVFDEYRYVDGNQYAPGYVFKTPSFISIVKNQSYSLANIYNQIKGNGRPVIVYGYSSSKASGHYVVAYYTSATSSSLITSSNTYVMDPWQGWVTLQTFLNEYPSNLHLRYCS